MLSGMKGNGLLALAGVVLLTGITTATYLVRSADRAAPTLATVRTEGVVDRLVPQDVPDLQAPATRATPVRSASRGNESARSAPSPPARLPDVRTLGTNPSPAPIPEPPSDPTRQIALIAVAEANGSERAVLMNLDTQERVHATEGDTAFGFRVAAIGEDRVELAKDDSRYTIRLGEKPVPVAISYTPDPASGSGTSRFGFGGDGRGFRGRGGPWGPGGFDRSRFGGGFPGGPRFGGSFFGGSRESFRTSWSSDSGSDRWRSSSQSDSGSRSRDWRETSGSNWRSASSSWGSGGSWGARGFVPASGMNFNFGGGFGSNNPFAFSGGMTGGNRSNGSLFAPAAASANPQTARRLGLTSANSADAPPPRENPQTARRTGSTRPGQPIAGQSFGGGRSSSSTGFGSGSTRGTSPLGGGGYPPTAR